MPLVSTVPPGTGAGRVHLCGAAFGRAAAEPCEVGRAAQSSVSRALAWSCAPSVHPSRKVQKVMAKPSSTLQPFNRSPTWWLFLGDFKVAGDL